MEWDEAKPAVKASAGDDLSKLSIAELEARARAFEEELRRIAAEIAAKRAHEAAAAAFFKSR